MYYQNYEDYMRSVLGYPNSTPNTYDDYYDEMTQATPNILEEREEWYPEIYRIVYPMVCKTCDDIGNRDITEQLIDEMTNNIYINLEVEEKEDEAPKQELRNGDVRNPRAKEPERETRQRRPNNPALRDLIRILILREIFDRRRPRPPVRPPRPPMPGPRPPFPGGPRPSFPGGPGMPPPMPRNYNDLYY